ncbi:MAG TPA: OsmC family protein [Candidatus Eisenbacteria bacterium]|jgi:organic hydroperoxide reductase OsmC/OhrA
MSTAHTEAHEFRCRLVWTGAANGGTTDYETYSREYRIDGEAKSLSIRGTSAAAFCGDPTLWNPEEMLVAALSACHFLTYAALCARARITVVAYEDNAWGEMKRIDGRVRFSEVVLRPRVTIASGDPARARALHGKAHEHCFIAGSVNFPVRHEPYVEAASPV